MSEIRTWVWKVSEPLEWVATSSPDKRDDVSPVYIRIGAARVATESRLPAGPQRGGVGTVGGVRYGNQLPVREA